MSQHESRISNSLVIIPTHHNGSNKYPYPPTPCTYQFNQVNWSRIPFSPKHNTITNISFIHMYTRVQKLTGARTTGAGFLEAFLLDDEAGADEGARHNSQKEANQVTGVHEYTIRNANETQKSELPPQQCPERWRRWGWMSPQWKLRSCRREDAGCNRTNWNSHSRESELNWKHCNGEQLCRAKRGIASDDRLNRFEGDDDEIAGELNPALSCDGSEVVERGRSHTPGNEWERRFSPTSPNKRRFSPSVLPFNVPVNQVFPIGNEFMD